MARSQRNQAFIQFGLFCGIILFVNILASSFYTQFDLTEEKRFTLTKPTKALLSGLDDRIYVQILLEGKFPAGFKRLQTATREMLDDFRSISGYIDYKFDDPLEGSAEDVKARQKALLESGIAPVNLRVNDQGESKQQLIYPVAIFNFGQRKVIVNLLENQSPTLMPDEVVNNSVSLLEYKFANAIKKLQAEQRPAILFTRGHGELDDHAHRDHHADGDGDAGVPAAVRDVRSAGPVCGVAGSLSVGRQRLGVRVPRSRSVYRRRIRPSVARPCVGRCHRRLRAAAVA